MIVEEVIQLVLAQHGFLWCPWSTLGLIRKFTLIHSAYNPRGSSADHARMPWFIRMQTVPKQRLDWSTDVSNPRRRY